MLNEEKVILMTKLASYEETEGKQNEKIGNYFRGDYLTVEVLKSLLYGTIAFVLGFGLYILYDFDVFMEDIYRLDIFTFAQNILTYYVIALIVYAVITFLVYSFRYTGTRKKLKRYYHNLKKLSMLYQKK
ncbi:MAG: hypothetical protein IKL04_05865 [Lachnospiraceae bacterium]|nr:hypothetical protein [Lachnospiraceae bacterium]